jgi:hypothetical protein
MQSKVAILAAAAAVALAGYAALLVCSPDDVLEEASDAYTPEDGKAVDARRVAQQDRDRFVAAARGFDPRMVAGAGRLPADADEVPPPPLLEGPGSAVTPAGARAGFDYAMRRVEKLVERRRRLSTEQWQVLYREANDAYAALSIVLDARDERELAELERAHKRLKEGLAQVRVRGKKFGP